VGEVKEVSYGLVRRLVYEAWLEKLRVFLGLPFQEVKEEDESSQAQ